ALTLDRGVVDEDVLPVLLLDEPVALGVAEPLHPTCLAHRLPSPPLHLVKPRLKTGAIIKVGFSGCQDNWGVSKCEERRRIAGFGGVPARRRVPATEFGPVSGAPGRAAGWSRRPTRPPASGPAP